MKRKQNINKITNEIFDIAVIGGGVTGAGILREAGKRGYRTILIEKGDFASGTSSKSAKLIHGGLRYLQYGQIGLVRESLQERDYLLNNFPHIVQPIPLLFPSFKSKFIVEVGMILYQFFGSSEKIPKYRSLDAKETLECFPPIKQKNLEGSFIYYDAVTNDARLTNEVVALAEQNGNSLALNYLEMTGYHDTSKHLIISCFDHIEQKQVEIKTQYVINATGPWVDDLLAKVKQQKHRFVEPGKGIHLVLSQERFPTKNGVLFESYADDKRMLYAVPWENNSVIIGATDTPYFDDIDKAQILDHEIEYLLHGVNSLAPKLNITRNDILSTFVGMRPLYKEEGKETKDMSRDYHLWWTDKRMLNIVGGKLTTFRSMAKQCVKKFMKDSGHQPTSQRSSAKVQLIDTNALSVSFVEYLEANYHKQASVLFQIALENPDFAQQTIHQDFPVYVVELLYFIRHQHVYKLDDMLTRRFSIRYVISQMKNRSQIILKVAQIMQQELEWTAEELKSEIDCFEKMVENRLNVV